jgi:hypothetical protein
VWLIILVLGGITLLILATSILAVAGRDPERRPNAGAAFFIRLLGVVLVLTVLAVGFLSWAYGGNT